MPAPNKNNISAHYGKNSKESHKYCPFNPSPDDKIYDWSKLKEIADNILKYIQNEK